MRQSIIVDVRDALNPKCMSVLCDRSNYKSVRVHLAAKTLGC